MRLRLTPTSKRTRGMMIRIAELSGIRIVGGHENLIVEIEDHYEERFLKHMGDVAVVSPA